MGHSGSNRGAFFFGKYMRHKAYQIQGETSKTADNPDLADIQYEMDYNQYISYEETEMIAWPKVMTLLFLVPMLFVVIPYGYSEGELIGIGVQRIIYEYFGTSFMVNLGSFSFELLADLLKLADEDYLVASRVLYRPFRYEFSNAYVYGMFGINSLKSPAGFGSSRDEALIWGAGVGFEYDLRIFLKTLPAFFVNFDAGIEGRGVTTYGVVDYLFLNVGAGLHFKF